MAMVAGSPHACKTVHRHDPIVYSKQRFCGANQRNCAKVWQIDRADALAFACAISDGCES